tara:strand:- start:805 stop:999 length:195 start_codon:yes stop_codon:yes gene_type:complete
MRKRNLTKKEKIEKLLERREFLITELYASETLNEWDIKGLTKELKSIRERLNELNGGKRKKDSL